MSPQASQAPKLMLAYWNTGSGSSMTITHTHTIQINASDIAAVKVCAVSMTPNLPLTQWTNAFCWLYVPFETCNYTPPVIRCLFAPMAGDWMAALCVPVDGGGGGLGIIKSQRAGRERMNQADGSITCPGPSVWSRNNARPATRPICSAYTFSQAQVRNPLFSPSPLSG